MMISMLIPDSPLSRNHPLNRLMTTSLKFIKEKEKSKKGEKIQSDEPTKKNIIICDLKWASEPWKM